MTAPPEAPPRHDKTFQHPTWIAGGALVALTVSWIVALRASVPGWERAITARLNDAPDLLADALYPAMQLGTVWAPLIVAVSVAVWKRDLLLPFALLVGGLTAWFAAKSIKHLVERDRPESFIEGLEVRDATSAGYGYVSGHSAVATVTMITVMAALPRRQRPVALVLAGTVGIARIVFGAHLPADVIGGWALGALIGVGAVELVDRVRPVLEAEERSRRP